MTPIGRVLYQLAGLPGLDGTFADSACAWGTDADASRPGIFGPKNLPATFRTDWVMNANDSYWLPNPADRLEGYARIIGCEKCQRTLRSRMIYHYVLDRLATGQKVTPESLRGTEHQNRGNHIFEEFVKRLPSAGVLPSPGIWKVPFDPADPVNTPRDLDETNSAVIKAMKDAIAYLRSKGIPMDATWGSVQVAGDRGAPAIPLGGGLGDEAGNANALDSYAPQDNLGFLKPVTFGSSHIQAVSFLPDGRLDAHTILTYGQSEDPTSPWSSDQTAMFGRKQWVDFPWTQSEIARQQVSQVVVTN
jgi:acyl-homoserine-lactone acylase